MAVCVCVCVCVSVCSKLFIGGLSGKTTAGWSRAKCSIFTSLKDHLGPQLLLLFSQFKSVLTMESRPDSPQLLNMQHSQLICFDCDQNVLKIKTVTATHGYLSLGIGQTDIQ